MVTLKNFVSENAEAECPPEDTYTWELTEVSDLEEQDANGFGANDPAVINTQSRLIWTLVDYDFDPDEDERDWNGFEARTYITFYRRLQTERDQPEKDKAIFKSERSVAFKVLTALGFDVEGGEDIELSAAVGTRVKASVTPKESGWPKLENFGKTRQKKSPFKRDEAA